MNSIVKNITMTMSSREIAEICEKEHRHVLRDIDKLNETYEKMGMPKVEQSTYVHWQNGQVYREFLLTKEQSIDLITGYRINKRVRISRRWQELEQQLHKPLYGYAFANALRAYADEVVQKLTR